MFKTYSSVAPTLIDIKSYASIAPGNLAALAGTTLGNCAQAAGSLRFAPNMPVPPMITSGSNAVANQLLAACRLHTKQ
tara:strand:+ start:108859 stop:109092 length:234 start_codon:yes stop_codon:yes gene_type:complete